MMQLARMGLRPPAGAAAARRVRFHHRPSHAALYVADADDGPATDGRRLRPRPCHGASPRPPLPRGALASRTWEGKLPSRCIGHAENRCRYSTTASLGAPQREAREAGRRSNPSNKHPSHNHNSKRGKPNAGTPGARKRGGKNDHGHYYANVGGPLDPSVCHLSEDDIHSSFREMLRHIIDRNYDQANAIRARMRKAGVSIDDKSRQWRGDGKPLGYQIAARRQARGVDVPSVRECTTLDEAVDATFAHWDVLTPRQVAAFWAAAPRLLREGNGGKSAKDAARLGERLETILQRTLEDARGYGGRNLSTTALGLARIVQMVGGAGGAFPPNSPRHIVQQLVVGADGEGRRSIFDGIAEAAVPSLPRFEPRDLANFLQAYALAGHAPQLRDGTDLFDRLSTEVMRALANDERFAFQELTSILASYAVLEISNPELVEAIGERVASRRSTPEALSGLVSRDNFLETYPDLAVTIAEHIIARDDAPSFDQRTFARLARTLEPSHPELSERMVDLLDLAQSSKAMNQFGHDYAQAGGPIDPSVCSLSEEEIHGLLRTRVKCRMASVYSLADKVRDDLARRGVALDDDKKEWRADGKGFAGPTRMGGHDQLGELIEAAHGRLGGLKPKDLAAFWIVAERLLTEGSAPSVDWTPHAIEQLSAILDRTLEDIASFTPGELSHVAFRLAKLVKHIGGQDEQFPEGNYRHILQDLLIGPDSERKDDIFHRIADAALPILDKFGVQDLYNVIYGFAVAGCEPSFDDGSAFFDELAMEVVHSLETAPDDFDARHLSMIPWAYANIDELHPELFDRIADHILALDGLRGFNSLDISNLVSAYSKANMTCPKLFQKVADHIVALDNLTSFRSKALSNIVKAYAAMKERNPLLFEKVASYILSLETMREFSGQDCAYIVWAYATMKEPNPELYQKIADHIVTLDNLDSLPIRSLSNIVWAYATARESHPKLFEKVAEAVMKRQHEFIPRHIANCLWAFATNGQIDQRLFKSLEPSAVALLDKYSGQGLSNVAWAYAVAGVDAPSLFNGDFITACVQRESEFSVENLSQLHQWNLWQEELNSSTRLPPPLKERCHDAFILEAPTPSSLQHDVMLELAAIGLQPKEEYLTERGYSLDAMVEVGGNEIGIEVDGPFHFVGGKLNGKATLKHRQVTTLDRIPLVSVPYMEWNDLGTDRHKKQQYLGSLLRMSGE